jgi:hypothetical protein
MLNGKETKICLGKYELQDMRYAKKFMQERNISTLSGIHQLSQNVSRLKK